MSNFLTSFLWKGVELNDGNIYGIPLADQGLDDPNSADASSVTDRWGANPAGGAVEEASGARSLMGVQLGTAPATRRGDSGSDRGELGVRPGRRTRRSDRAPDLVEVRYRC